METTRLICSLLLGLVPLLWIRCELAWRRDDRARRALDRAGRLALPPPATADECACDSCDGFRAAERAHRAGRVVVVFPKANLY